MIPLFLLCFTSLLGYSQNKTVYFSGSVNNDLYRLLQKENVPVKRYATPSQAIENAKAGSGVLIVSESYPVLKDRIEHADLEKARKKNLRMYIEFHDVPGLKRNDSLFESSLERGVVRTAAFGGKLKPMSILSMNDLHVMSTDSSDGIEPLLVLAKVAGFDHAAYGIDDVKTYPLLFHRGALLIATTKLSNYATARYGPEDSWQTIWTHIFSWLLNDPAFILKTRLSYVTPMYTKEEALPADALTTSIKKGAEWFTKARFFIDTSWKEAWLRYQSDGLTPVGPPVSPRWPNGDGTLGIIEGHVSDINVDGSQQYRYWVRADVQGEVAYALAAAGNKLNKSEYYDRAKNLGNYLFFNSNLRAGLKNDPARPAFGLIGWSVTHPFVFYGDDNARCVLGLIGASAYMKTTEWDDKIAEAILANLRTTGKEGFRGPRLSEADIEKEGLRHFQNRDLKNPHPHFESWLWACYLWLYDKTGYKPLLETAKKGIRNTMDAYPDGWKWTNGIQQERARMILPLAWLVKVEDTPEHRGWLDAVVERLLSNQTASGAIREELGGAGGQYGRTASNREYGLHEAPLIFHNGDPVADMLYTSNFAFFSLNEAAHATGNKKYHQAVQKLSNFLTRIQIKSDRHPDLDGAWFRAFDFDRWEYWASNADAGWGAWSTLTGWIQSWILTTQVLVMDNRSFWDLTKDSEIDKKANPLLQTMMGNHQP